MAINLSEEERLYGKANFANVSGDLSRRGFMKSVVVAGGAVAVAGSAGYYGYQKLGGKPVKAALIGGGDEGGVLLGEHNPDYIEFVAVCDIRPTNMKRIFEGEGPNSLRRASSTSTAPTATRRVRRTTFANTKITKKCWQMRRKSRWW